MAEGTKKSAKAAPSQIDEAKPSGKPLDGMEPAGAHNDEEAIEEVVDFDGLGKESGDPGDGGAVDCKSYELKHDLLDGLEDDTGYCKPPKKHRWKKGQSGNPKGKASRKQQVPEAALREALAPIGEILAEILSETHEVPVGGGLQKMTTLRGGLRSYSAKFLNAGLKEKNDTLRTFKQTGILDMLIAAFASSDQRYESIYTEEDRRLLEIARDSIRDDDDEGGVRIAGTDETVIAGKEAGRGLQTCNNSCTGGGGPDSLIERPSVSHLRARKGLKPLRNL